VLALTPASATQLTSKRARELMKEWKKEGKPLRDNKKDIQTETGAAD